MTNLKEIMLHVQERLGTIGELSYIDKNWGQLSGDVGAVKYPCALIDIENVTYSQQGKGLQMADVQITVTIANLRLTPSSSKAPNKAESYATIELIEQIHSVLQLYSDGDYAPLFRTNLRKMGADNTREAYQITYQTAYTVLFDTGERFTPIHDAELSVQTK